ncbi:hypothetical protein NEOC65_001868 [Neochlamydia sp. AcF65]|nr:hypothetical protein [Neochlamydia sp. AcF65]
MFFPYLAKIDLSYCSSLTNLGFQAIMSQAPQLQSLKLDLGQQLAPTINKNCLKKREGLNLIHIQARASS